MSCGLSNNLQDISIHSLRMEGDLFYNMYHVTTWAYFNPLPPHGGRLDNSRSYYHLTKISIHSLRMEGDQGGCQ